MDDGPPMRGRRSMAGRSTRACGFGSNARCSRATLTCEKDEHLLATSPERDDLAAARVASNKWKARADAARRQILSPALLQPLLHERLRTFQARRGSAR